MGIASAEGLYTGHPDFEDICVGYEVELCCDYCGKEFEEDELFNNDGDMVCADCLAEDFEDYDSEKSPIYYEDAETEVVKCCNYCEGVEKKLYIFDGFDICCKSCACREYYNNISDDMIGEAISRYYER